MQGALIRGVEGRASRVYFAALSLVIPPDLYRGRRSQHPAEDVFNAYLNYCYGILYNEVEKACILAGLDPYIGFLHAERYGKRSFVYDVIEQFRQPVVDRMVITLAVRGRMQRGGHGRALVSRRGGAAEGNCLDPSASGRGEGDWRQDDLFQERRP